MIERLIFIVLFVLMGIALIRTQIKWLDAVFEIADLEDELAKARQELSFAQSENEYYRTESKE